MNDPAEHATIVDALHSADLRRQKRLDPCPLRIRKPEDICHLIASQFQAMNRDQQRPGILLLGPEPSHADVLDNESSHLDRRRSHVLSQALGGSLIPVDVVPHIATDAPLCSDETLLLCSDRGHGSSRCSG